MIKMGSYFYGDDYHKEDHKSLSEHVADLEKENEELKEKVKRLNSIVNNANTEIKTLRDAIAIVKNARSNYGTVEE